MKSKYLSAVIATFFAAPSWGQLLPKMPAPSPAPMLVAPKPAPVPAPAPVVTAPVLVAPVIAPAIAPVVVVAPAQPAAPALPALNNVAPPPLPKPPVISTTSPPPVKAVDRPQILAPAVTLDTGKAQVNMNNVNQGLGASGLNTGIGVVNTGVGTPNLDLSGKIPGAGGASTSQNSQQTSSASPTPNTLYNPQEGRPQDGKAVGSGYFKNKGERLMDLAKPQTPQEMSPQSGGGNSLTTPSQEGGKALGNVQTTVTPGQGKNTSSRRQQSSSGANDDVFDSAGNNLGKRGDLDKSATQQTQGGYSAKDLEDMSKRQQQEARGNMNDQELDALGKRQEEERRAGINSKEDAERLKAQMEKELGQQPAKGGGGKKTPAPDQVDDSHMPSGPLSVKAARKSPSEQATERSRQVTLPSEGQTARERVRAAPGEGVKAGVKQRTDGRINPSREDGASPPATGTGGQIVDVRPRGVDGAPKVMPSGGTTLARPLTQPRGGNTPDNPTAAAPSTNDPSTGTGVPPPTN